MTRQLWPIAALSLLLAAASAPTRAANAQLPFNGEWRTSFGVVTLRQTADAVTGTYGNANQFTLKGSVSGNKLTFEYHEGPTRGDAHWTLDDTGHAFRGRYQLPGNRAGPWDGWRPDPQALTAKPANLTGLWLTDLGLVELEQTGDKVKGRYALRGTSEIKGTVTGRRLEFTVDSFRPGTGWFDASADAATLAGAATTTGAPHWYGWRGRRAPEYVRHAKLVPGKIVVGSTTNLLTYAARAPETFKPGDGRKWPAIVILHGSNMNARAYVSTIAAAWPDLARDYLLIGINGERPSDLGRPGADPTFNYTYVSYVGRSTFKGFPRTDRESPALVAEGLDDLRAAYPVSHYFVGGHSQGGFLTYSLLMNFPEKIAGAFPISAGVIFQAEPAAYADQPLRAAQRAVPLAIVHGKSDAVVGFDTGEYAATLFGEANWPAFRFFADASPAGHRFGLLPVNPAVRWLEAHASDDPAKLLDFAEQRLNANAHRDAVAALNRARALNPTDKAAVARVDRLARAIDAKAAPGAKQFLPKIRANTSNDWIDAFLAWRDDFEFAPAARETVEAFNALRAQHDAPAKAAFAEARTAFQQNRPADGYAKYQEIVDKQYAAPTYRTVKRWLADRK
jgi:predicted esterase